MGKWWERFTRITKSEAIIVEPDPCKRFLAHQIEKGHLEDDEAEIVIKVKRRKYLDIPVTQADFTIVAMENLTGDDIMNFCQKAAVVMADHLVNGR